MECLVCGNNKDNFLDYFSANDLVRCQRCGFVFRIGRQEKKEDYFHKEDYAERLTSEKQISRLRNCQGRLSSIRKIIKSNFAVLDIGCNEGFFLKTIQEAGGLGQGLEPNFKMVEFAQRLGLSVKRGTIEEFETKEKFNLVTLFHVLEHLQNPNQAIRKIGKWLKTKGYLVLESPNIESYLAKKMKESWPMLGQEHLSFFSPKTIRMFLEKNSFAVRKISFRQFDEWNLSINECLIRLGLRLPKRKNTLSSMASCHSGNRCFIRRIILLLLRKILCLFVKIFKRGDYILVIAQRYA